MLFGLFEWLLMLINFSKKCMRFYERNNFHRNVDFWTLQLDRIKMGKKNLKSTLYNFDIERLLAIFFFFGIII
jgi:hypothetical protein